LLENHVNVEFAEFGLAQNIMLGLCLVLGHIFGLAENRKLFILGEFRLQPLPFFVFAALDLTPALWHDRVNSWY
jgi:hypothetical protein